MTDNGKRTELMALICDLFNIAMDIQEIYLRNSKYSELSMSEMHVIEAVYLESEPTMTNVDKRLMVTVGTLTTAVNRIVQKGFLERHKSPLDKRIVMLALTLKGRDALNVHDDFHKQLEKMILEPFEQEDYSWVMERMAMINKNLQKQRLAYLKENENKHKK